jgi:hypothetical protein
MRVQAVVRGKPMDANRLVYLPVTESGHVCFWVEPVVCCCDVTTPSTVHSVQLVVVRAGLDLAPLFPLS